MDFDDETLEELKRLLKEGESVRIKHLYEDKPIRAMQEILVDADAATDVYDLQVFVTEFYDNEEKYTKIHLNFATDHFESLANKFDSTLEIIYD